jgi:dipeptidyl aminopeptidase/acylaminoacyl peptidase
MGPILRSITALPPGGSFLTRCPRHLLTPGAMLTQRAKASARRTMPGRRIRLGRAAACVALSAGAAACLAPAAGAVAPGANGRLASFGYAPGTAESWVEQGDPVAGGPLVPVSRAFAGPDGGTADRYPSWSPDGRLVLSGDPDGNAYTGDDAGPDLIVTDADGRTRTNLTRTPDVFELEPAWSPDGTQIAFSVGGPFGPGESLWVMNADGTGSRRLGAGSQPAWSPDGRRLAFSRDGDIHTTTRGGGDVRQVTSDPGVEGFPTWAPDGRHIAWSTKEPVEGAPDREDVWMARVDGRQRQRLVATPRPESAPAFSPDGTQLAFSRQGPDECCPGLWVLSLASGDQRRVAGTDGADWERRNRLPVAGFTADPEEPRAGMLVTLRSFSSDADGPLASQRWDLDEDGRFDDDAGERASVTLDAARPTLTVRLRVRDADGAEATASRVLRLPAA